MALISENHQSSHCHAETKGKVNSLVKKIKSEFTLPFVVFFFAFGGQFIRNAFGWTAFFAFAVILFTIVAIKYRKHFTYNTIRLTPLPLILFVLWCTLSVFWSNYPTLNIFNVNLQTTVMLGSAIQLITVVVALLIAASFNLASILESLTNALKWILGLSLVFELFVSTIIKQPVSSFTTPKMPWSEAALFTGGPIQGIVGNRNLLAFIALLLIITVTIQYYDKFASKVNTITWLTLSATTILLTQSATITLAVIALLILTVFILVMRKILPRKHKKIYYLATAASLLTLTFMVLFSSTIFSFLGRDSTASGRTGIWRSVIELIRERPIEGWGWMGYWNPTAEPFDTLSVIGGITYLQAHNAVLDIWVQVGFVGLLFALMLTIIGSVRAWRLAVSADPEHVFTAITLLPILLLAALFIQSLTESRILIEGNFLLLVILCYKVKELNPPHNV